MCVFARCNSQSTVATRKMSVKSRLWLRIVLELKYMDYKVSIVTHAAITILFSATEEPRWNPQQRVCIYGSRQAQDYRDVCIGCHTRCAWRCGTTLVLISEVKQRRARWVVGWVTVQWKPSRVGQPSQSSLRGRQIGTGCSFGCVRLGNNNKPRMWAGLRRKPGALELVLSMLQRLRN